MRRSAASAYAAAAAVSAARSQRRGAYDAVIVGGGIAGSAMTCSLAAAGVFARIALVEPAASPASVARSVELKASSATRSAKAETSYGAQPETSSDARPMPAYSNRVWDAHGSVTFDCKEEGSTLLNAALPFRSGDTSSSSSCIGHIVENSNLVNALTAKLHFLAREKPSTESTGDCPTVDLFYGLRVDSLELPPQDADSSELAALTLSSGERLEAALVIGADGANSRVREAAGIQAEGWSYNQMGLVATLQVDPASFSSARRIAFQRYLPGGPLALLPLPGDHYSMVWSVSRGREKMLRAVSPGMFCSLVNAAVELDAVDVEYVVNMLEKQEESASVEERATLEARLLDEIEWRRDVMRRESGDASDDDVIPPRVVDVQEGSRAAFPLRFRKAFQYHGPRVALIGDAAHVVHPQAGQGLNLGLKDVRALTATLVAAQRSGQDLGSTDTLRAYNDRVALPNLAMMAAIDGAGRVFGVENELVGAVRGLGMSVLDRAPTLKQAVMRYAMGRA